jgi:hypothetical protein
MPAPPTTSTIFLITFSEEKVETPANPGTSNKINSSLKRNANETCEVRTSRLAGKT